jgi:hypothetical protein
MKFKFDDGGMKLSKTPYEKLDCTVRSLAIFFNTSYDEAHDLMSPYRKSRHRTKGRYQSLFESLGLHCKIFIYPQKTVGQFLKENPRGNFMLRIKGHIFTVKDSVLHDTFQVGLKTKLIEAWFI